MMRSSAPPSIVMVAISGLASLAAAMGIGRFAFTPMLPLMQQQDDVTLAQGAWLAAANYLGYLVGALASYAVVPSATRAIRFGLLAVAISTAAMALPGGEVVWLALRFCAGAASAFVLVGVAGRALAAMAAAGRQDLGGWVFSGVGIGVVFTGLTAVLTAGRGWSAQTGWVLLGCAALAIAVGGWGMWTEFRDTGATGTQEASDSLDGKQWALVTAYGGFGLGYIIPATFLPAMARSLVSDPMVFGWAWPIFGVAAAVSTVAVAQRFRSRPPRLVFVGSVLVMAVGVALPAVSVSPTAIVISALCVGGTFMVATMTGLQEAKRIVRGPPVRLIAAMTAAFALGQLSGPVLVGLWAAGDKPVLIPSLIAVAVLLVSAAILAFDDGRLRDINALMEESPSESTTDANAAPVARVDGRGAEGRGG